MFNFLFVDSDLEQRYGNLVLNLEAVTDEMKKIGETNEQLQDKLHTSEEHAKNVENLLQNVSFHLFPLDVNLT